MLHLKSKKKIPLLSSSYIQRGKQHIEQTSTAKPIEKALRQ